MLFGANVCQRSCECFKLPALHCWSFYRFSFFTPLQACVQFFGVCSAFIRCLLTFFVLTAFEVVFIFNALGLRVSLFDLPAAYKVFFFFFFSSKRGEKKRSIEPSLYTLEGTTWWHCTVPKPMVIFLSEINKQRNSQIVSSPNLHKEKTAVESVGKRKVGHILITLCPRYMRRQECSPPLQKWQNATIFLC